MCETYHLILHLRNISSNPSFVKYMMQSSICEIDHPILHLFFYDDIYSLKKGEGENTKVQFMLL